MTAEEVIKGLGLQPLEPEGGYFRRTYESNGRFHAGVFPGGHFWGTAIFYLVTPKGFSALHRLPQEEMFHFYLGDPVEMVQMTAQGDLSVIKMGHDLPNGQKVQVLVPSLVWQGTRLLEGGKWALLGCTVVPGFEYEDYEHAEPGFADRYPKHREILSKFLR